MFRWSTIALALACFPACGSPSESYADKRQGSVAGLTGNCVREKSASLWQSAVEAPQELRQFLNAGLPQGLTLTPFAAESSPGASHYDFHYVSAEGIPLCSRVVRAHFVGERRFIDGQIPVRTLPYRVSLDGLQWHDSDQTARLAARSVGIANQAVEVTSAERCFLLAGDQASAAWDLTFTAGGRRFKAIANGDRVREINAQVLHATGSARVFDTGPADGKLVDVDLGELLPGDSLASARFRSEVASGPVAKDPGQSFTFDPSDARFPEVSAFAHVVQMANWLTQPEHHYDIDCVPITIRTHVVFVDEQTGEKTTNNAQYITPDPKRGGLPEIWIGDGDGFALKDIALDFDTVAHELGHHVIYRKLSDVARQSPSEVLHEGLADFLVSAKTGNACIGESICVERSGACEIEGRCLRTGENTLNFTDPSLPRESHVRSQLISGMLWDLGKEDAVGLATMATLVIKGVDYLLPRSDYDDFVKALMSADLELFDGIHACRIKDGAVARGFGDLISGLDCADYEKTRP